MRRRNGDSFERILQPIFEIFLVLLGKSGQLGSNLVVFGPRGMHNTDLDVGRETYHEEFMARGCRGNVVCDIRKGLHFAITIMRLFTDRHTEWQG